MHKCVSVANVSVIKHQEKFVYFFAKLLCNVCHYCDNSGYVTKSMCHIGSIMCLAVSHTGGTVLGLSHTDGIVFRFYYASVLCIA